MNEDSKFFAVTIHLLHIYTCQLVLMMITLNKGRVKKCRLYRNCKVKSWAYYLLLCEVGIRQIFPTRFFDIKLICNWDPLILPFQVSTINLSKRCSSDLRCHYPARCLGLDILDNRAGEQNQGCLCTEVANSTLNMANSF